MTIPTIHMIEATGIIICKGFALFEGVGVNDSAMIGFIVSFTIVIPEFMAGSCCNAIFDGIVWLLGIRLNMLSKENGHISRTATSPHNRQVIHFGAFFRSNLAKITARIIQLAVMLIFKSLINTVLMISPPF